MVLDTVFILLVMDMVILDTLLLAMAMDTVLAMPIMDMESVMLRLSQRLMLSMEPMVDMVLRGGHRGRSHRRPRAQLVDEE